MTSPHPPPLQEEDVIVPGRILAVGAGALIVFLAGTLWAWSLFRANARARGPAAPAAIGLPEVGSVFQTPFDDDRYEAERREQRRQLGSYGWSDRRAGTIYIPIEKAMERVAAGKAPWQGAPAEPHSHSHSHSPSR